MNIRYKLIAIFVFTLALVSCGNNEGINENKEPGKLVIEFEHYVDGNEVVFDEMKYENTAGNEYEVTEVQWFISDVTLNKSDGSKLVLEEDKFAHYIDTNLPETYQWQVAETIPIGEYNSISITFGIKGEKNTPYMYTDPPESNMLWPINLGGDEGGYHYMKLNGFWMNNNDERKPFNFHLGVGQERDAENNIIGFIQNWFEVELPSSAFAVKSNEIKSIAIRMNIENWWDSPNIYNHDVHGGMIMQNQEAMHMGIENGNTVFSIGTINTLDTK